MIGDRYVVKILEGGYWPHEMIGREFVATEEGEGDLVFKCNGEEWGVSQEDYFEFPYEILEFAGSDVGAQTDPVNPPHYTRSKDVLGLEVYDILKFFFADSPDKWNAGKYLLRAGHKGDELTDIRKAIWYLNKRAEQLEAEG